MTPESTPVEIDIPAKLQALLRDVGPRWAASGSVAENVALMCREFAPVLARAPKQGVTVVPDIAYGAHPRQRLDLFAPDRSDSATKSQGLPVVVFVHGGAFVDGDKNKNDEIYANVLHYFARNGFVGINLEYRLAPEFAYPSGTEDVALAMDWVRARVAEHGGDASRVFLIGHSSGAAHAASYAYDPAFQPTEGNGLRGLVVLSGRVRADFDPANPNIRKVQAYYGTDASLLEQRSALSKVAADSVPTFIGFAEFENPLIDVHSLELASRIAKATGKSPRLAYLRGHNHTSLIAHINTSEDHLGREIRAFIDDILENEATRA
ncbi:conserved hypothetical protein [Burkholderiales bacterium 8X]|nr:conserved hypothetical protein [Burkholderiales bacterium 8X]